MGHGVGDGPMATILSLIGLNWKKTDIRQSGMPDSNFFGFINEFFDYWTNELGKNLQWIAEWVEKIGKFCDCETSYIFIKTVFAVW